MKMQRATALLLSMLATTITVPAFAEDEGLEEIVVTGTRIKNPNVLSSSQIAVVGGGGDIEARGITRVEDFLNDLPQISPGQSITNANGANGAATVNLRNLGCERTLVLVNGRRMSPGTTGGGNCADLNAIPTLLLDRVEVLTGGASSVYGSDAVAGVVNFIMDDDFEGFKFKVSHSFYQHDNDDGTLRDLVESNNFATAPKDVTTGESTKYAFAFGGSIDGGRGHISAYAEKTDTNPILQGEYDISACALRSGASSCGGSSTIPPGRWDDFGSYGARGFRNRTPGFYRDPDDLSSYSLDYKLEGDEFVDRAGQLYNFNPTNFFQRPDERLLSGVFGHYAINDHIEVYAELSYMKSESNAQIAYSGTFGNISELPCYNALLSAQQYQVACGDWEGMGGDHAPDFATGAEALAYISGLDIAVGDESIIDYKAPLISLKRNVEGGPRQSLFQFENFVQTFGVRGDINDNWSYDVYYQSSEIDYSNEYRNDLSVIAINRAVDVISVAGVPTCVSALNGTDSSCVPYNLFSGGLPGDQGIQAALDGGAALQSYVANATYILGDSEQTLLSAFVSGELPFGFPGAPSGISLVVGYEQKDVSVDFRPDLPSRTGDRSGSGGATLPIAGSYDVDEYYVELGIPVTEGLSFDAGFRRSSYSTDIDTDTFKVGAYWRIMDQVAIRGSYQESIRHANIFELFQAQGFDLTDLDEDPCGLSRTATQAQCAATGLAASLYGTDLDSPAGQYNVLEGGNLTVQPEEATSYTLGVVLTPLVLDGLTVTVDYFDIQVEEGIDTITASTVLDECIAGNTSLCGQINRHPVNGSLWLSGGYISQQTTNLAEESISGVDIIFDYAMDTRFGTLTFEGVTTWLDSFEKVEFAGAAAVECAGAWGASCDKNPLPEWSGNYKVTLATEYNTDVALGIRYLGEVDDLSPSNKIDFDAFWYFDLTATYHASENIRATGGISNLLDKDPEGTSNAGTAPGNGNTFPAYFDALGRYAHISLELQF